MVFPVKIVFQDKSEVELIYETKKEQEDAFEDLTKTPHNEQRPEYPKFIKCIPRPFRSEYEATTSTCGVNIEGSKTT